MLEVVDMSESFSLDDKGWDKFISTGSVYDYLEYRDKIDRAKNYSGSQDILLRERDIFGENGSKWYNSQGSGA